MSRLEHIKATLHNDKMISLEAAKLLGFPFTFGAFNERTWVFKYVPTDKGVEIHERQMRVYSQWKPISVLSQRYLEIRLPEEWLYRVTFHDEEPTP